MIEDMTHVVLFVKDYDEALTFIRINLALKKSQTLARHQDGAFCPSPQKVRVRK